MAVDKFVFIIRSKLRHNLEKFGRMTRKGESDNATRLTAQPVIGSSLGKWLGAM